MHGSGRVGALFALVVNATRVPRRPRLATLLPRTSALPSVRESVGAGEEDGGEISGDAVPEPLGPRLRRQTRRLVPDPTVGSGTSLRTL